MIEVTSKSRRRTTLLSVPLVVASLFLANAASAQELVDSGGQDVAQQTELNQQARQLKARTTWHDPHKIAGHEKCVDCHKQEIRAWQNSKHSARAFDLLRTSESALKYAEKLGIKPREIATSAACINCHATPMTDAWGHVSVFPGVSCEACHGASDGEEGWLNAHSVYGGSSTIRQSETPDHFAYRQERCEQAGQLRSSNLYGLTKRCFDCHVVGDEMLAEAGHTQGDDFEMVGKALGEIRHNFSLNKNANSEVASLWLSPSNANLEGSQQRTVQGRLRVLFLLGQIVDLEVSLRNLARATEENDFSDSAIGRIENAFELLAEDIGEDMVEMWEELQEEQEEESGPGELGAADPSEALAEIAEIVAIALPIWEALDNDGFDPSSAVEYVRAAEAIGDVARRFSRRDGSSLGLMDELELLPEDYFDGAFSP